MACVQYSNDIVVPNQKYSEQFSFSNTYLFIFYEIGLNVDRWNS